MTFHNALNYGAALQVYASQQAINKLGVDCEIINYVNQYRQDAYSMSNHVKEKLKKKEFKSALKYCVGSLFMNKRRIKFERFYKEKLLITEKSYTSSSELEEINGKYNKFIVGSDQVWNHSNNGKDFAFFLDFVKDYNKKIAYSSSFGLATIPEELKGKYTTNLSQIKHISTRESYGVKLIRDLTRRDAELVLDPVFLLDKKHWESLIEKKRIKEKIIFCYTNRPSQFEDFISQTGFSIDGYKIHKLTSQLKIKDFLDTNVKVAYSISPIKFIETIAKSELVVSASFHCISMAIILNVPFVAVLTGDKGKDERVLNILRITGLEDRILNERMTINDINKPINFHDVEECIDEYRKKSIDYLKNAIHS